MNIVYSRGHVEIERNGKTARFNGDLGSDCFRASASSMKWLWPKSQREIQISEEERKEWMDAINSHCANAKDNIFFVDDKDNPIYEINNAESKNAWSKVKDWIVGRN